MLRPDPSSRWLRPAAVVWGYFTNGPKRKLLRRRLYLFSAPIVALLLLVAGHLLSTYWAGVDEVGRFDRQDVPGLHEDARGVLEFNVFERWKAHFAEGDADMLQGKLPEAAREFDQALALVDQSESCPVRVNLTSALESMVDQRAQVGSLSEARALVAKARKVVGEAPPGCFDPASLTGVSDQDRAVFAETGQRLELKADQLGQGDLHFDPKTGTYHYTPGTRPGKLEKPGGAGPCPQPTDPEQTACIRDRDKPPSDQEEPPPPGGQPPPSDGSSPPPPADGSPPPSGGKPRQANPSSPNTDDVAPDKLPAANAGPVVHKLSPQSGGDPADKLWQTQADADGTGANTE